MSLRGSLVLLALASGACFSDTPPGGLSTGSGTSTADASTAATTGGSGTTRGTGTGDATTAQPTSTHTTGPGTGEATLTTTTGPSTTAPETTGTTDPGTATSTTTTGPDSTSTTTGAGDFDVCKDTLNKFQCYSCCGEATPNWDAYYGGLAECACVAPPCQFACASTLCEGDPLNKTCFDCIAPSIGEGCYAANNASCMDDPGCVPFFDCIEVAGCAIKPN